MIQEDLETRAVSEIESTDDLTRLNEIRIKYIGRRGIITEKLAELKNMPLQERKKYGSILNSVKEKITAALKQQEEKITTQLFSQKLKPRIDITLPGKPFPTGKLHPITQILNEIKQIFFALGFSLAEGPEIESDYYNFEALNIPKNHPARDEQDTFYITTQEHKNIRTQELLLRTHTSPVQIRVMEKQKPPVRIIAAGKVYRHEAVDASHSFVFHQVEGLAVDEGIDFAELKTVLTFFVKKMFGNNIVSRFRPSYFPFTEPSAEVDIRCFICKGQGCSVCKHTGWVELLGCGMVNPKVFEFVGYDTKKYTGYAFGLGVERIAMLKFGIDDMRLFYENNINFLTQF